MKNKKSAFDLTSFILPIFYITAIPWEISRLIKLERILRWMPKKEEKILPSEIKATYFEKWQRIRYGKEVNLPIIVKKIDDIPAKISQNKDKIIFDDFKFSAYKTKDGFLLAWKLKKDEHLWGGGERFSSFNLRGRRYVLYTTDTMATNSTDRSYKPVPFLLSSEGYAIFLNTSAKILFDARGDNLIVAGKGHLDLWRIKGTPKEILSSYTDLTGRPPVIPKWAFGLWISRCMYPNRRTIENVVQRMKKEKIPVDVVSIDPLWLKGRIFYLKDSVTFEWNKIRFPKPYQMIKKLKSNGIKVCLWINPYIPLTFPIYQEAKKNNFLVKKEEKVALATDGPVAVVDFSNNDATNWYKDKLKALLKQGVALFKTDYGESAPDDADYKGYNKIYMHNLYPLLYNKAVFDATKEEHGYGIVWGRSAWAGSQRYPLHWSGDARCTWNELRHCLIGGLNFSLSGFSYWSNDIGGFVRKPSDELYIRWFQFGLFVSNPRLHGTTPREPWVFGREALNIFKYYANLRYKLIPYLYSYAHISSKTGHPILRPMLFEFPDDKNTYNLTQQYMLGEKLLIAPVLEKGKITKNVYFPKGKWINWYSLKEYSGPCFEEVDAPLNILPIFVRKDAIIPLGPDISYVDEKKEPLTLLVFSPQKSNFILYDDNEQVEFLSAKEGKYILFKISPSKKEYIARFYKTKAEKTEAENIQIDKIFKGENYLDISFKTNGKEAILKII